MQRIPGVKTPKVLDVNTDEAKLTVLKASLLDQWKKLKTKLMHLQKSRTTDNLSLNLPWQIVNIF